MILDLLPGSSTCGQTLWTLPALFYNFIQLQKLAFGTWNITADLDVDAYLRRCLGHVPWEETPRQTQDTFEGLYLLAGLGTPRYPPQKRWWKWQGTGASGACWWHCCPRDPDFDNDNDKDNEKDNDKDNDKDALSDITEQCRSTQESLVHQCGIAQATCSDCTGHGN